jgi:hypothetical protein
VDIIHWFISICQAVYERTHLQVQIKVLDNMVFLVSFSLAAVSASLCDIMASAFQQEIDCGEI